MTLTPCRLCGQEPVVDDQPRFDSWGVDVGCADDRHSLSVWGATREDAEKLWEKLMEDKSEEEG